MPGGTSVAFDLYRRYFPELRCGDVQETNLEHFVRHLATKSVRAITCTSYNNYWMPAARIMSEYVPFYLARVAEANPSKMPVYESEIAELAFERGDMGTDLEGSQDWERLQQLFATDGITLTHDDEEQARRLAGQVPH